MSPFPFELNIYLSMQVNMKANHQRNKLSCVDDLTSWVGFSPELCAISLLENEAVRDSFNFRH